MAAEKLTKKRLIQILVMLGILICAFFYRSCQHSDVVTAKSAVEKQPVLPITEPEVKNR